MADEPDNVLALLHEIRAEQRSARADMSAMRADQASMRTDMASMLTDQASMRTDMASMRADQVAMRADISRMDAKLDRAAVRADDVMGAQVRMQTDIRAIRAEQEDHGRILAGKLRQDVDDLRERVEALEAQQRS
jgi:hypothetical protein